MIFLLQFGINKHLEIFQRPQSALALRACALLLVFEKSPSAYLFQIALEIMWLPIQTLKNLLKVCDTANHFLQTIRNILNMYI